MSSYRALLFLQIACPLLIALIVFLVIFKLASHRVVARVGNNEPSGEVGKIGKASAENGSEALASVNPIEMRSMAPNSGVIELVKAKWVQQKMYTETERFQAECLPGVIGKASEYDGYENQNERAATLEYIRLNYTTWGAGTPIMSESEILSRYGRRGSPLANEFTQKEREIIDAFVKKKRFSRRGKCRCKTSTVGKDGKRGGSKGGRDAGGIECGA